MKQASLVIVGLGIKFKSHLTVETETYIKNSDKVFYLANEPIMKKWIQKQNANTESLDYFYGRHPLRLQCYQAMTEHVLDALRKNQHICFALYGHPTIFAKPALDAAIQARNEGYDTKILPGISAEDCLFADLLINPSSSGCQSYEATDFLLYSRKIDSSNHVILWQVGIIGALGYPAAHDNSLGIKLLIDKLRTNYADDHVITLYEAAQYPHFFPLIESYPLCKLSEAPLSPISTLYIPPAHKLSLNKTMLTALNIINEHH